MSGKTIWKEQVDQALKTLIRNNILVTDLNSNTKVFLDKKNVIVRKPEDDFKIPSYPCISVYALYDRFSEIRYSHNPNIRVLSRDIERKRAEMEKPPKTYDLNYQIDFWALKQSHMNEMTMQWAVKFIPYYNLDLNDMSGSLCNVLMNAKKDGIRKQDLLDKQERIFHSFITYTIWAEVYDDNFELPIITDVVPRGNEVNTVRMEEQK